MFYVGTGLLILVATFGLFVAYIRVSQSMLENTLRDDIRRYVESKGGTVTFDEKDGMNVTGPLATGYQNLMSVRLIAGDSGGDRELRLGLALSKFVPTKLDEMRAKGAAERIAGAKDAIGALTRDELLAKARVAIVSTPRPNGGTRDVLARGRRAIRGACGARGIRRPRHSDIGSRAPLGRRSRPVRDCTRQDSRRDASARRKGGTLRQHAFLESGRS